MGEEDSSVWMLLFMELLGGNLGKAILSLSDTFHNILNLGSVNTRSLNVTFRSHISLEETGRKKKERDTERKRENSVSHGFTLAQKLTLLLKACPESECNGQLY